ncbi:hypothetical protein HYQ46_012113 [Verticillium longisporum]|nr:hypothetical protein HYQ46_012113 [Verticillium longisporum]
MVNQPPATSGQVARYWVVNAGLARVLTGPSCWTFRVSDTLELRPALTSDNLPRLPVVEQTTALRCEHSRTCPSGTKPAPVKTHYRRLGCWPRGCGGTDWTDIRLFLSWHQLQTTWTRQLRLERDATGHGPWK